MVGRERAREMARGSKEQREITKDGRKDRETKQKD